MIDYVCIVRNGQDGCRWGLAYPTHEALLEALHEVSALDRVRAHWIEAGDDARLPLFIDVFERTNLGSFKKGGRRLRPEEPNLERGAFAAGYHDPENPWILFVLGHNSREQYFLAPQRGTLVRFPTESHAVKAKDMILSTGMTDLVGSAEEPVVVVTEMILDGARFLDRYVLGEDGLRPGSKPEFPDRDKAVLYLV